MTEKLSFNQRLSGYFEGVLRWNQFDELWTILNDSGDAWYIYQVGSDVPDEPLTHDEFTNSLKQLASLLQKEHDYDYCGIVYTDHKTKPSLIKVYDPNNLGSSCGCGGDKIPPRWIISIQQQMFFLVMVMCQWITNYGVLPKLTFIKCLVCR